MITEDYVSFETAKLLKEKGFKHWCYKCYGDAVYYKGVPISFDEECELKSDGLEDEIEYVEGGYLYDFGCDNRKEETKVWAAPTLWVAMKWLREVYGLFVRITEDMTGNVFEWSVYQKNYGCKASTYVEDSYEKVCEAAIRYTLENLI